MVLASLRMILLGTLLGSLSVVHAESEISSAQLADIQAAAEENPTVCKPRTLTGSRIVRRYCLRKSQWDAMREDG